MELWSIGVAARAANQHSSTPPLHHSVAARLFLETDAIVRLHVVSERAFRWVEPQLRAFAIEPFSFLGVAMRIVRFDPVGPRLHLSRALGGAMFVEPSQDFFIAGAGLQHSFDVVSLDSFEIEQALIERTGVMIFTDGPIDGRAAFINHSRHQGIIAESCPRAPRSFFRQVFCSWHRFLLLRQNFVGKTFKIRQPSNHLNVNRR
jgi:hypothetical protein